VRPRAEAAWGRTWGSARTYAGGGGDRRRHQAGLAGHADLHQRMRYDTGLIESFIAETGLDPTPP
jgi:hypothetical protein